jgi:hypothetical protein
MTDKKQLTDLFGAAHVWQSRGWQTIPAQPDSKRIIAGFGRNLEKAESGESLEYWFRDRKANLAVIAPPDGLVLDFDRIEVYHEFSRLWPKLSTSLTEATPRGGRHLFVRTVKPIPPGLVLKPGIEIIPVCLVYPSVVGGIPYEIAVTGDIMTWDIESAIEPFLVKGAGRTPSPVSVRVLKHPGGKQAVNFGNPGNRGIISQVRERWPILAYLRYFEPKLFLTGRGRWYGGLCPWHDDSKPSLWVDADRDRWGCQACKVGGDVVNWHAKRLKTDDMVLAARDLAKYQVEVTA